MATDGLTGLYIPEVTHVQLGPAAGPEDGPPDRRTARAGASGKAISPVDEASALSLEVERFIGRHPRGSGRGRPFLPEIRRRPRSATARPRLARRAGHGRGPRPGGPAAAPGPLDGPRRESAPRLATAPPAAVRSGRAPAPAAGVGAGEHPAPANLPAPAPQSEPADQRVPVPAEAVPGRRSVPVADNHGHARRERHGESPPRGRCRAAGAPSRVRPRPVGEAGE